jgi:two-component system nitrate/nitrite response regulator NarL
MRKIRMLLIEDNRLLREGILAMLKKERDIDVVAASGNRANTVLKINRLKPNVILLDLGLRSLNSLHVVESAKKEFPRTKVIVMDLAPVPADILQYEKAGASGFILKDTSPHDFLTTIRTVSEGKKVVLPSLSTSLFSQIVEHAVKTGGPKLREAFRMTKRELDVIALIGGGLTNREIGQRLHISVPAVRRHVHNTTEKLALHARLEVDDYSFRDETVKSIARSISILDN